MTHHNRNLFLRLNQPPPDRWHDISIVTFVSLGVTIDLCWFLFCFVFLWIYNCVCFLFFCRCWQQWADRAELNAQLTHYLCFWVWGRDAKRLLLFSYLTVGLWFVFFHYLGDISDRSWQRKTIDFFRVFFVLYHQNMYLFWNDFCICTFVYVLYCVCRSWLWQWEHFRPAAETLFLCLYTVLASFPFFWISWISPPHLFIFL